MTVSNYLFELVHSLSQAEKRYFKIFSSSHQGGKEYIRLFDAIAKQKSYDEQKLKERLKIKGFAVAKTYLYKLILRSLRSQQSNNNIRIELKDMLKDVEILFQKGLYEQSSKLLQKAKKVAIAYEKYPLLLEIYQLERQIANYTADVLQYKRIYEDDHREVADTMERYWEQMEQRKIINLLLHKRSVSGKFVRSKQDEEEMYARIHTFLTKDPKKLRSYKAGIFHFNIQELYYHSVNDVKNAYLNSKKAIEHMESDRLMLQSELNNYMNGLSHLMEAQILLHKYDELKVSLDKLKALELSTDLEKARAFGFGASKEIVYYVRTGRYAEGLKQALLIDKQLHRFGRKVNTVSRFSIYASVEELYFCCDKFRQALQWNNRLLNDPDIALFHDYYSNARISEIVIHYELKNTDKVQSLLHSYYQFLSKRNDKCEYEKEVVRSFKNILLIRSPEKLNEKLVRFREVLQQLENNPYEKEVFSFFDLNAWLESKIQNRSFALIMKEKYER